MGVRLEILLIAYVFDQRFDPFALKFDKGAAFLAHHVLVMGNAGCMLVMEVGGPIVDEYLRLEVTMLFPMPDDHEFSTRIAVGLVELEDAETGERVILDTGNSGVRNEFERLGHARGGQLRDAFRSMNIDHAEVVSGSDYVKDLVGFFRSRERRRR